eukprot:GFUD01003818.1.p1 GENE.GFUD01003818.1~~GFUD01003818.1.p1  ORF type:complete len:762 (+),score=203.77 GFUD01003818.1:286-2286(+)
MVVTFSHENYSPKEDNMKLVFHTGNNPSVPKGTVGIAVLNEDIDNHARNDKWEAVIKERRGRRLTISVMIPVDAPIGMWEASIETSYEDERWSTKNKEVDLPLYIIFNPYVSTDPTYLPNQAERQEYLMEDVGKIYAGTSDALKGRPWVFGQFESTILPAACHVLESARIRAGERANPIQVARAISAMVNSNDGDNGVLVGKWNGKYEDGTDPYKWSGSVRILEDYMRNGGRSIRYGQCWVFAGIITTICRALGLPCRPVTCYKSAHDTNKSLTIDKYYDQDGEELRGIRGAPGISDSIWNFHCWNDVWMARHDLPEGYGGWQVIDATPQEESDNVYQVGPTSVEAVRRGDVGLGYDTAFVFTEVNADVMVFVEDPRSSWGFRKIDQDTSHVGKLIVTQAVGQYSEEPTDKDWEDITHLYKNKEGTREERSSVMRAIRGSGSAAANFYDQPSNSQDVFIQIFDLEKCSFGKPYKVGVYLHNRSTQDRTVKVVLSSSSVFYTGVKAHLVKKGSGQFKLKGNEEEKFSMEIFPEDYMSRVVDMCFMKNFVFLSVAETDQAWSSEDDFVLEKPDLNLWVQEGLRVGEIFNLEISFTNPLDLHLTKCEFNIEAPGVVKAQEISFRNINPGEDVKAVIPLKARNMGKSTLMVVFNALELFDITGTKKVSIM